MFEAVAAARRLLDHEDPKIVATAMKMILEFEKVRLRKVRELGHDPWATMFVEVPPTAAPAPEPQPVAPPEPDAESDRPETLLGTPFDRPALCPPAGDAGRLRGVVEPSITSFLPPRLTGSPSCPRPTPTPPS